MAKKTNWFSNLLIIGTIFGCLNIATAADKNPRVLKWQVTNYKMPSALGWDQAFETSYQDSLEVTLCICLSESPATFNLFFLNPYQFFYAERDTSLSIQKCVFQIGLKNADERNADWPGSLTRKFLAGPENTTNLPPRVANLLEAAFQYAEKNFSNQKTGSK